MSDGGHEIGKCECHIALFLYLITLRVLQCLLRCHTLQLQVVDLKRLVQGSHKIGQYCVTRSSVPFAGRLFAGLELAGLSPAKCPEKSAANKTVCVLRTPKESLLSGIPKEEFGRMIFEKNLPWGTVLTFSSQRRRQLLEEARARRGAGTCDDLCILAYYCSSASLQHAQRRCPKLSLIYTCQWLFFQNATRVQLHGGRNPIVLYRW